MVMRNWKKEALEFMAQLSGVVLSVYTVIWFMVAFS